MTLRPGSLVLKVLGQKEELAEALDLLGVDPTDLEPDTTLADVSVDYGIELEDLINDLTAALEELEDDEEDDEEDDDESSDYDDDEVDDDDDDTDFGQKKTFAGFDDDAPDTDVKVWDDDEEQEDEEDEEDD